MKLVVVNERTSLEYLYIFSKEGWGPNLKWFLITVFACLEAATSG